MNTAYYAMGDKHQSGEGGLTMVTMQQSQMDVTKFNTMDDSFKHRDSCHALKRNIAGMNDKFESGKISTSLLVFGVLTSNHSLMNGVVNVYHLIFGMHTTIALKQSDAVVLQPGRSWYLLRLVLILYCLDHL
jgi:hypothetical protein